MIVCLHGFAQGPESWRGIAPLGALCPPLPGHCGEPPARDFADAVRRLADAVPTHAALAGYSLGARLALALCLWHPEKRIEKVLLISGTPGIDEESERQARRDWDDDQAELIEREGLERFVARWEKLPIFAGQTEAMRQAQHALRTAHDPLGLASAMRDLGQGRMPSLWPALEGCTTPLRLLVGQRDEKYCGLAARMAELAPDASVRLVDGAGHNLLVERPEIVRAEVAALQSA